VIDNAKENSPLR